MTVTKRGILALTLGIAICSVQDVILKQLSGDYPLHQAMVLRSLTALPFHLAIVWWFDGRLSTITTPGWWKMLARGVLVFVAYSAPYLSFATVPVATVMALTFTSPLFITIAAVLFLGERLSLRTAFALAAGFAGILLVVRPSTEGLDSATLPILGALCYALAMVVTRPLGRTESAAAMAFWVSVGVVIGVFALPALYRSEAFGWMLPPTLALVSPMWIVPTAMDLVVITLCGAIGAAGILFVTQAYRITTSSTIAPLEYSSILWAILWAWAVGGRLPDVLASWLGIAVIIGAGLLGIRGPQNEKAAPEGAA